MIFGALLLSLLLAWLNLLLTGRWADVPGALHGWRWPYYALSLAALTALTLANRRAAGRSAALPRTFAYLFLAAGISVFAAAMFSRLPPSTWNQIPFKDDWTLFYQEAVYGVELLRHGTVVGWNWWLMGGYPTSTDIAQNFAILSFLPMTLLGDRLGYHVFHAVLFLSLPVFVWRDARADDPETGTIAAALTGFLAAGYFVTLANSGDTNSLVGVFCTALALAGSRTARRGRRWGSALLLLALTLALYTHAAFFVYAAILLALEAAYFRDRAALIRLVVAAAFAGVAALPQHWESLRYGDYVSFNNFVYDPSTPKDWSKALRTLYYNIEILVLPHRWFNDYRSLANVWLPVLAVAALRFERSRAGFYACATVLAQLLLRFNIVEASVIFDRVQHLFPILAAPALAGAIRRFSGTRAVSVAWCAVLGLYVATSLAPIRHVPDLRSWNPALIDRITAADGMVLVEHSPHRDVDAHPDRRTQTTPFDVHFEGLLGPLRGQRFYAQMVDGWVWNRWRGQIVAAGTWRARPLTEIPADEFIAELRRWGVRHLFVWTDAARSYLAQDRRLAERWRDGRWSHVELLDADTRDVVTRGSGTLRNLDLLGGEVMLTGVTAGDPVVIRANYHPAWRARAGDQVTPLYEEHGQLAFTAPRSGDYVVRLDYPRYRWLTLLAFIVFAAGLVVLCILQTRSIRPSSS